MATYMAAPARDVFGRPVPGARAKIENKDGHKVATVTAPSYLKYRAVLDRRGLRTVTLLLDPASIEFTGAHVAALMRAAANHLGLALMGTSVKVEADRCWFACGPRVAEFLGHSGAWSRDKNAGRGHEYEPDWKRVGSWRSNTHVVSAQAVVYRHGTGPPGWVVEIDLDMKGFRHIKQVVVNALGGNETDPVIMGQMCAYWWPLQLPFDLSPRERA
jgi:hypothetical protein